MGRKKQCNGRDSRSKRRGIKSSNGCVAKSGNILVRQKGSRIYPGRGAAMGSDFTIYATREGTVSFIKSKGKGMVEVLTINTAQ